MTKVLIRLELGEYSVNELIAMWKLNILTREEVRSEMMERGMNELKILSILRAG